MIFIFLTAHLPTYLQKRKTWSGAFWSVLTQQKEVKISVFIREKPPLLLTNLGSIMRPFPHNSGVTKHNISAGTSQSNSQAWCWRGNDLVLFSFSLAILLWHLAATKSTINAFNGRNGRPWNTDIYLKDTASNICLIAKARMKLDMQKGQWPKSCNLSCGFYASFLLNT